MKFPDGVCFKGILTVKSRNSEIKHVCIFKYQDYYFGYRLMSDYNAGAIFICSDNLDTFTREIAKYLHSDINCWKTIVLRRDCELGENERRSNTCIFVHKGVEYFCQNDRVSIFHHFMNRHFHLEAYDVMFFVE